MKLYAKRALCFTLLLAAAFMVMPSARADYRPEAVIPLGVITGIEVETDGVVVTGYSAQNSPAARAGIKPGDIIVAIDGRQISSGSDLRYACARLDGEEAAVSVVQDGCETTLQIAPELSNGGGYELGVVVRDGLSGIGTLTFIDPRNGFYGALGHGVTDSGTGAQLPLRGGAITHSAVTGVVKGASGAPGRIVGMGDGAAHRGSVAVNSPFGIFGIADDQSLCMGEPMPLAAPDEVKRGEAYILSDIGGEGVRRYDIEIIKIYGNTPDGRNMSIKVVDKELLIITGGIVQGMSGSPIIQDGKLIGAVTHVLVNDPAMGYGIFIENMLEAAG